MPATLPACLDPRVPHFHLSPCYCPKASAVLQVGFYLLRQTENFMGAGHPLVILATGKGGGGSAGGYWREAGGGVLSGCCRGRCVGGHLVGAAEGGEVVPPQPS